MTLRITEVYPSIQCEGPRIGMPTTFLRTAGCNLRCPGWPCDTQHAIDPSIYNDSWQRQSPTAVALRVDPLVANVCWTGGEPFLQPEVDLRELAQILWTADHEIECFSNGTIAYPDWAIEEIAFI